MLAAVEGKLVEILEFRAKKANVFLRPSNQVGLRWLWQVEQVQTTQFVDVPLLGPCHRVSESL